MTWFDNKLMWNVSEYGGLENIRLPYDKVWKPVKYLIILFLDFKYIFINQKQKMIKDVILYNNADNLASLSQISTHMIIDNNGNVTWLSTSIFKSSCSINVRDFPFDQQSNTIQNRFILVVL